MMVCEVATIISETLAIERKVGGVQMLRSGTILVFFLHLHIDRAGSQNGLPLVL